jgi:hypothetical protein
MSVRVTAILLSYKRPLNMPAIIDSLRGQSEEVEIWVINNSDCGYFREDRSIHIPWNAGEWARYVFAPIVDTEYVLFQDDDWLITDDEFVEMAIEIHTAMAPDGIVGIGGRAIERDQPHYIGRDPITSNGYTPFLWGHVQLFKRDRSREIVIPHHPYASDIHWSLQMGGNHWVSSYLRNRVVQMDEHGVGLSHRDCHMEEREAACAAYFAQFPL